MVATFPEDPEAWSESLTPAEGEWYDPYPNNTVHLDRVYKKSGEACIAVSYDYYPDGSCVVASMFYFHLPQDLRGYKAINFLHLLQAMVDGKPAFTGNCYIVISGAAGYIIKDFGTVPGAYESKSWDLRKDFKLGMDTRSIEEVLSKVYSFKITAEVKECYGPFGQKMFIDRIYFSKELGTLYVQSKPSGKTFTFDGRGFVTPHGFRGAVGDEHTVVMSDEEFVKWEDGSTDRTRVVTIPEGSAVVTAYYEEEVPPPPPKPPFEIPYEAWVALGLVLASSGSVLLLGGRWLKVK